MTTATTPLAPMDPRTIRRLMRAELDSAALAASDREERIALDALRLLVERGVIREHGADR